MRMFRTLSSFWWLWCGPRSGRTRNAGTRTPFHSVTSHRKSGANVVKSMLRYGDRVTVSSSHFLVELRGKSGVVSNWPSNLSNQEPNEYWIEFVPPGADLAVGEIDAAAIPVDDLVRTGLEHEET
ncbi:hypothetical protein Q31a_42090 [Aureliella helgolandensis]|uniref:Uncharacterized protein n=1 Tax=Aureliella helgolandensis TaxID=2527968 RepID=A0A518GB86_9BACT|nr:hypothetical protein Q31a_42090 [Aureliella helgolandensis]